MQNETTWLELAIYGLACFRLALMISKEDGPAWIFQKLRRFVKREAPKKTALHKGISCEWCVSVWMSSLLILGRTYIEHPAWYLFVLGLAISAIGVILNQAFTKS